MHPMTEGLSQHNITEEYKTRPVNINVPNLAPVNNSAGIPQAKLSLQDMGSVSKEEYQSEAPNKRRKLN